MAEFDAVIIGGGPAGSASAILLARLGLRTALVDRGPAGRPKTCGHCLAPRARGVLDELGLTPDVDAIAHGRTTRLRVHAPGCRRPAEVAWSEPGWVVDRGAFDELLIERAAGAGVEVIRPASAPVDSIEPDGATVRVAGRLLRYSLLVGADGLASGVARATGLATRLAGRKFGFALDVDPVDAAALERDAIEMFIGKGGYLGVVRQRGGIAHLGGLVSSRGPARAPLDFIESLAHEHDALRRIIGGRVETTSARVLACGPMPCAASSPARGRVALVGDAAGYVEPFTGEGMAWAIESASCLGAACARGAWDPEIYTRLWRERVGRRTWACRVVSALAGRPALAAAAVRLSRPAPWPARLAAARVVGA